MVSTDDDTGINTKTLWIIDSTRCFIKIYLRGEKSLSNNKLNTGDYDLQRISFVFGGNIEGFRVKDY